MVEAALHHQSLFDDKLSDDAVLQALQEATRRRSAGLFGRHQRGPVNTTQPAGDERPRPGPGVFVAGTLLALVSAVLVYGLFDAPLGYSGFIAGEMTWRGGGKVREVAAVLAFIAAFALATFLLTRSQRTIAAYAASNDARRFEIFLLAATVPFAIWLGSQFLSADAPQFRLLYGNALALAAGVAAYRLCAGIRGAVGNGDGFEFASVAFCVPLLGTLSAFLIPMAAVRFPEWVSAGTARKAAIILLVMTILWPLGLFAFRRCLRGYLSTSLVAFQGLCAGYYVVLYPSVSTHAGELFQYPASPLLAGLLAGLTVWALVDLAVRADRHRRAANSLWRLISPTCIAPLLVTLITPVSPWPEVYSDDYHHGELLLPLQQWLDYGTLPYHGLTLPHGLVDAFSALGAALFLEDKAAYYSEAKRIVQGVLALTLFLVAVRPLGLALAFLLSLFTLALGAYANAMGYWYLLFVTLLLIVLRTPPGPWLGTVFVGAGGLLFAAAPGQGAIFIIAMLPIIIYRVWVAGQFRANALRLAPVVLAAALLGFISPSLREVIWAAMRYVFENSAVNSEAYGLPWHLSWGSVSRTSGTLFETIRFSWLLPPVFAVWLVFSGKMRLGTPPGEARQLFIFALVFLALLSKYALDRIDPGGLSRPGITSMLAVLLSALILSRANLAAHVKACAFFGIAIWMGLFSILPQDPFRVLLTAARGSHGGASLTDLGAQGLPMTGKGLSAPTHLERLKKIERVLKIVADRDETLLDLTNRNALYYYLDRRMPVEAAPYNMPHPAMQRRSVHRLVQSPPPLVLLQADSLQHDGRSVAVRTHLLYRWVLNHYVPVKMEGLIFGVRPDRLTRLGVNYSRAVALATNRNEQLRLWDSAFRLLALDQLPVSWGYSTARLGAMAWLVKTLSLEGAELHSLAKQPGNEYLVTGSDPFVAMNLDAENLSGAKTGLLFFDFSCSNPKARPLLEIYWSADGIKFNEDSVVRFHARNGRLIVPLDTMPRWLLAQKIDGLRIDLADGSQCQSIRIDKLSLQQRRGLDY